MNELIIKTLRAQAHSPVRNYVIPGLTSWLIGEKRPNGSVTRMFEMTRQQQECIAPHSHRSHFTATVLQGRVVNRVWTDDRFRDSETADAYGVTKSTYLGSIGNYATEQLPSRWYTYRDDVYTAGQIYRMHAQDVHSIFFDRNTLVLFEEGPPVSDSSIYLEPVCYGEVAPTFKVEPRMFKR